MTTIFKIIFIALFTLIPTFSLAGVDKSGIRPNVVSLPSGPGSVEGLGESFEPQLNSGTTSYAVALKLPPGRAGFQPDFSLRYNGGNANGVFGPGWSMSVPFIQRQTDKGLPQYDDTDTFIESGGEELVPVGGGLFRHENEGAFVRYEKSGEGWIATNPSGVKYTYGPDQDSQIKNGTNIFCWLIREIRDTNGNTVSFQYLKLDSGPRQYLTEIAYNNHKIRFEYESRPDALADYRPTFRLETAFRCKSVSMKTKDRLIRRYDFAYFDNTYLSLLRSVTQVGDDGVTSLPPAEFTYTQFDPAAATVIAIEGPDAGTSPPGLRMANDADAALNDMNADGLPDLLIAKPGKHEVYLNMGMGSDGTHRWGQWAEMSDSPGDALGNKGASLADITGDGKTDFISWRSSDTYFLWPNMGNGQWGNAETFADKSNFPFDFEDEAIRLIDIDNDKHIDVMYCNGPDDYSYFINNKGREYTLVLEKPGLGMTFDTEPGMKLADMNGDRLQDIVLLKDGVCDYWPSMGRGNWEDTPQRMTNPPDSAQIPSVEANWEKLMLMDINGDGLSDIVYAPDYADKIHYWLNRDSRGFDGPFESGEVPVRLDNTSVQPADMNGNGTTDFLWNYPEDADGNPDKIWQYLELCPDEKPNLLKTVTNGIGKTIFFHYSDTTREAIRDREAGNDWSAGVPTPVTVLSGFDVADGRGNLYQTAIVYHDGFYDGEEKEFRGFAHAEKQEIGDNTIPDLLMVYQFDTGAENDALKGKPLNLSVKNTSGQEFYQETYIWQTRKLSDGANGDLRDVTFPFQEQKIQTVLEKGNGTPVTLKWEFGYDDFGNMTRQYAYGRTDTGWDDERITETVYTAAHTSGQIAWILNKAVETSVTDETGARASHQRSYFDNLPLGQVGKGNLTKAENWVEENHYAVTVRNDYDIYGNVVTVYDALYGQEPGHTREIIYDSEYHTFPIQEIIHTGDTTLTVSAGYDFGLGVMTASTDFNSHTTSYGYDSFGRLIHVIKPPDAGHTVEYEYILAHEIAEGRRINWVETRQRDNSADDGFLLSRSFYDGMGRKIMTRTQGEETGQIVVTDTLQFNARKQPWKTYLPYFETSTLDFAEPTFNTGFTEHFYDAMGREIQVNQPAGPDGILFSTTEYQPLSRIVRDEEQTNPGSVHSNCGMKYVEDGLQDKDGKGRLREVYEIVRLSDMGESLSGPVSWKTAYEYDLLDKLVKITDSQNNRKFMEYDGLGRKTFMNDPDRGTMAYEYDDAGNLVRTTDAKGQVIRYEYDGVNRLTAEYYGESKTTSDVAYHYDEPYGPVEKGEFWSACSPKRIADAILQEDGSLTDCDLNQDDRLDVADVVKAATGAGESVTAQNLRGFLSWVEDASGEEHNSYDVRGRVEWVVKRIAGNSGLLNFYTAMDYDSMDRVTILTYPDQSHVTYSYNSRGLLESVPGIIEQYDFNPSGQNALLTLACGTRTDYEYDHRLRLTNLQTQRQKDSLYLQDLSYTFDGVSNITGITDGRTNTLLTTIGSELGLNATEAGKFDATQSFVYDSLYRLTYAENPAVYGSISYHYDRIGNMIAKNATLNTPDLLMDLGGMTCGGTAGTSGRTGRDAEDQPGPHAITGTQKGPDGAMAFAYDANGNMTLDRGMTLAWDFKDRLEGIAKGAMNAAYSYDYTDTRKRKSVIGGDTGQQTEVLYVDKFSEVRDGKLVKYVYAGNSRVARGESSGAEPGALNPEAFYLHDHLGSTSLTLSESGAVREQMVNYPFGRARVEKRTSGVLAGADYKFTGKERDLESGLQYFEARYYSGVLGRFNRVDTLTLDIKNEWLKDPQHLNFYSYVKNNPIIANDPDGEFLNFVVGAVSSVALGYGLSLLTGEEYSWKQATVDAAIGAAGVGLISKAQKLYKLGKGSNYIGKMGEKAMHKLTKLTKNKVRIPSKFKKYRTPDGMSANKIHEVKNVTKLSGSKNANQLIDNVMHVGGENVTLWTRGAATHIEPMVQNVINKYGISVKYLPVTKEGVFFSAGEKIVQGIGGGILGPGNGQLLKETLTQE